MKSNFKKAVERIEIKEDNITRVAKDFGISRPNLNMFYNGYKYGLEKAAILDEEVGDKLGKREINIYKRSHKNNLRNREANKILREKAFNELFIEEYVIPKIKTLDLSIEKHKNKTIAFNVFAGDFHYDGSQRSENDFKKFFESLMREKREQEKKGINHINIIFGGDYIENTHHTQQQISKKTLVIDQIINSSFLIASGLKHLIEDNPNINYTITFLKGNHDEIRQLGVKAREDLESASILIRKLVKEGFKKCKNVSWNENNEDIFINDVYATHGDAVRGVFQNYMNTRREQNYNEFKNVKKFLIFHTHRFEHIIKKGTQLHFIKSPAIKSWDSSWERDNNQKGTTGYIIEDEKGFRMVGL